MTKFLRSKMATGGVTAHQSHTQQDLSKKVPSKVEQLTAVVEGCSGCSEQDLRARLSPYATIAWCNSVDEGRYLVRFLNQEGLSAAITAFDGSDWNGVNMKVSPYSVGAFPQDYQQESLMADSESIPSSMTGQLEYLNMLTAEEPQQQLTIPGISTSCKYPELKPCYLEWMSSDVREALNPLQDEVPTLEGSSSCSGSGSVSTSQLWTQRSIGASARKDLAKFAALQNLAQQHSNSSTPTPGLGNTSSMALSSPWGSFTASNCPLDSSADGGRRVSSPVSQATSLMPCEDHIAVSSFAATVAEAGAVLQQHLRAGDGLWGTLGQLSSGVGLGLIGIPGNSVGICQEDSAGMLRMQQSLSAQQQQAVLPLDATPALLPAGFLGLTGMGSSDLLGQGLEGLGRDIDKLGGSTATGLPPPPPPPVQQGIMGVPPPPPPPPSRIDSYHGLSSDGRLSRASSPVPAPPPRVLTPGCGQYWASPGGSQHYGQQPPSPSHPFRGPSRATGRPFQPGMSNLSQSTNGGPVGSGHVLHPGSEQAITSTFMSQQPLTYRSCSPSNRGPSGVPPPPPPGPPHPGYVAAAAAAAAGGIAASPIPPASPGRLDKSGYAPLPAMASAPAGVLDSLVSTAKASSVFSFSGEIRTAASHTGCRTGPAQTCSNTSRGLQADGALFVRELLQLLQADMAAENLFLSNLKDLLECALATGNDEQPITVSNNSAVTMSEGVDSHQRGGLVASNADNKTASSADNMQKTAFPVDAAAFLGLLQEAAAPLLAAAAAAWNSSNQHLSRGGSHRASNSSDSIEDSTGEASKPAQVIEPGKGLRPLRITNAGVDHPDMNNTPSAVLLRHLSKHSSSGLSMFYPLHPRTTTTGGRDVGSSSCGGAAPGTPYGTPMLLIPQTLSELLSARAALIRLMVSAHDFVESSVYSKMAANLNGVAAVYDSMHDDPVVLKRRKCSDMAAMREVVKKDPAFAQAVASVSSLRNHIYSLSRKVLIGFGHVDGLPVDLLLGGLTSELAAILTSASAQPPQSINLGGGQAADAKAGTNSSGAGNGPQPCLAQATVDFFTCTLPLPKLALLVFAEFVPVDPAPCCITPAPGTPVAHTSGGLSSAGSDGLQCYRGSNSKNRQGSTSSTLEVAYSVDSNDSREGWQQQSERRTSGSRHSRDGTGAGQYGESKCLQHSSRNRSGCFSTSDTKQRTQRRSQHSGFDLAAEAKELEAAASAAAPLVAAAVWDLPAGGSHSRKSSNGGERP